MANLDDTRPAGAEGGQRTSLLSRVTALLCAPLDADHQPQDLVALLVPEFADLCSVLLLDEAGNLRRVAEAALDPEIEAVLRRTRSLPIPMSLAKPLADVLATGQTRVFADYLTWVSTRLEGDYPEYLEVIRRLAPGPAMLVPLRARGRVIGALTLGMLRASGRHFGPEEHALAQQIGERAGLGIDNARLFAEAQQARRAAEAERVRLQHSEERRRLAVEAAQLGTWDFDPTSGALMLDARCKQLFGLPPDAEIDDAVFLARVHPDDRARVEAAVKGAVTPGARGRVEVEYRVLGADGVERWLCGQGQTDFDAQGVPLRFTGVVQDISDRKRAQQELETAWRRAEEANRAKDEFLAMLGHELRNPLSPILTALHLMRLRHGELVAREGAVIERQVKHMVRLVDDLLDISRITRGKVELQRGCVELADVLDKALELAGPLLDKRGHRLVRSVPREGLCVDGDAYRLTQIVTNLLSNAAHYTPPGGTIELAAHARDGHAHFSVRDSGVGIAADLLPRIFEPFVQGRRTLARTDGGLGLGLAIVRNLVELHGGSVAVTSQGSGCGSEFVVRLPLAAPAPVAEASTPGPGPRRTRSRRVLIVDDNRDAAELLAELLRGAGHVTGLAFDGLDALRLAAEFRPEVAFLDIGLPLMDGYELARQLRALPELAALELVAVTGYGQSSDQARARAAGFDRHLTKPVEPATIEALLEQLAARRA